MLYQSHTPNQAESMQNTSFKLLFDVSFSPRGENRRKKGLICYFCEFMKFWPFLHNELLSSVSRASGLWPHHCHFSFLLLNASSNHIAANTAHEHFWASVGSVLPVWFTLSKNKSLILFNQKNTNAEDKKAPSDFHGGFLRLRRNLYEFWKLS